MVHSLWNHYQRLSANELVKIIDYGHMMSKSLIIFGPNSNPNPKKMGFGCKGLVFFVEIMVDYILSELKKAASPAQVKEKIKILVL